MLYLGKLNVSILICHTTPPVSKRLQRFVQAPRKKKKDLCRQLGITTRLSFSVVILCSVLQEHLVILMLALCESLEVFVLAPLNNYRVVVLSTFFNGNDHFRRNCQYWFMGSNVRIHKEFLTGFMHEFDFNLLCGHYDDGSDRHPIRTIHSSTSYARVPCARAHLWDPWSAIKCDADRQPTKFDYGTPEGQQPRTRMRGIFSIYGINWRINFFSLNVSILFIHTALKTQI